MSSNRRSNSSLTATPESRALVELRRMRNLSQLDIAKILYERDAEELQSAIGNKKKALTARLSRRIGYLEDGKVPFRSEFKEVLLNQFKEFENCLLKATERGMLEAPTFGGMLESMKQREFTAAHTALMEHEKYSFDLFFINAARIPALDDPALARTWAQLLKKGVNYHVLWDLTRLGVSRDVDRWRKFRGLVKNIEENTDQGSNCGTISVYGYTFPWATDAGTRLNEWKSEIQEKTSKHELVRVFDCFDVVADMNNPAREVIINYNFGPASTLVYVPKENGMDRGVLPVVVLEISSAAADYAGHGGSPLYCLLGDPYRMSICESIIEFLRWIAKRENT